MKSNTGILVRPKPTHQPIITVTEHLAENLNKTALLTLRDHATEMHHLLLLLIIIFIIIIAVFNEERFKNNFLTIIYHTFLTLLEELLEREKRE